MASPPTSNMNTVANELPIEKIVPLDPWTQAYAPILAEFFGMLIYTFLSNVAGVTSGGVQAITLASCLILDTKILLGLVLMFVQFFGAFFGALLTRAVMKSSAFFDTFVSLGLLTRNIEFTPEENSELFSNRFQMFLMETILTFILTFTFIISSKDDLEFYLPFNVGLARAITAYIGIHSFSQSVNLARMLINYVVAAIFTMDDHVWRLFYIFVFAAFVGPVISAGIYWLLKFVRIERTNERKEA